MTRIFEFRCDRGQSEWSHLGRKGEEEGVLAQVVEGDGTPVNIWLLTNLRLGAGGAGGRQGIDIGKSSIRNIKEYE